MRARTLMAPAGQGAAAIPPTLTTVAIACSDATIQTAYGGRWSPCGIELNGSSDAANYSTIAYQWRNAAGNIGGATSIDYTPPTGAGLTGLYLRVTVDATLPTEIVVDSPVTTVAYAGYAGGEGNSNSSAQSIAITNDPGEKIYISSNCLSATGIGNVTFEGSGPTAAASHANHLGNTGAVANRIAYLFGKSDDNEAAINWTISTTGGSRFNAGWQIVGYGLTPTEIDAAGQSGTNSTASTVTVDVPVGGAIVAHAGVYDDLTEPASIALFEGSTFEKGTASGFATIGVGYLVAADAAKQITADLAGSASNKQLTVFVFTPEVPA